MGTNNAMSNLIQISLAPTKEASILICKIRTALCKPVEGNLFLRLMHSDSGAVWNNFRYDVQRCQHYFRFLPSGSFTLQVSAAGYQPIAVEVEISAPTSLVEICLQPSLSDRLVINVEKTRQVVAAKVAQLSNDIGATDEILADSQSGLGIGARLLLSFMVDVNVVAALRENDRAELYPNLATWIENQIRSSWRFHVNAAITDRLVKIILENRLRLFVLTRAVFANLTAREATPDLAQRDVGEHLIRFLSAIDCVDIDGLMFFLVGLYEPRRAVVEHFLRNIQNQFELRPPAGTATATEDRSAGLIPSDLVYDADQALPEPPGSSVHHVTPLLATISDALAMAISQIGGY